MILMLPFLLMTLHFSQIGFTDDLTFMLNLLSKKTVSYYNMHLPPMQAFSARTLFYPGCADAAGRERPRREVQLLR